MPIDDVRFQSLLVRAARFREAVNALDGASYPGVMGTINGRLRDRWHFPAPPAEQAELASQIIELLSNPRLSSRQADSLQRAFRGT
jgi:hypothetical protein